MGIEPFACSAIQTWKGSCILGVLEIVLIVF
jgi:hypothetical protein